MVTIACDFFKGSLVPMEICRDFLYLSYFWSMHGDSLDTEGTSFSTGGGVESPQILVVVQKCVRLWGMSREGIARTSPSTGNTNGRNMVTENYAPVTSAISSFPPKIVGKDLKRSWSFSSSRWGQRGCVSHTSTPGRHILQRGSS